MLVLRPKTLKELVREIATLDDPPPIINVGDPGTGKSYTVEQLAKELGRTYMPMSLGRKERADVLGIPGEVEREVTQGDKKVKFKFTSWFVPVDWQEILDLDGNVVLHLDEMTVAYEEVQNAILDLLLQKRIDKLQLPKKLIIIGSGNTGEGDGTFARRLTSAITGGRCIMTMMKPPTAREWVDFETSEGPMPEAIRSFILENPAHLNKEPDNAHPFHPWSCCRGWSRLVNIIRGKSYTFEEDGYKIVDFARGLLSPDTVETFRDHVAKQLISVDKLIKGEATEWNRFYSASYIKRGAVARELGLELNNRHKNDVDVLLKEAQKIINRLEDGTKLGQAKHTDKKDKDAVQSRDAETFLIFVEEIATVADAVLIKCKYQGEMVGCWHDKIKNAAETEARAFKAAQKAKK
jgi:hypothetical protein